MAVELGYYWNHRGTVQPVRLMLKYREIIYKEIEYPYSGGVWNRKKDTLGLAFPSLPYFLDSHVKLTQSLAITRYVAHVLKLKADSNSLDKVGRIYVLEDKIVEFTKGLAEIAYSPNFDQLKPEYVNRLPDVLKEFSSFLGHDKWFGVMENNVTLTHLDFMMYDALDQHRAVQFSCLDEFQNLKDFVKRFEKLQPIKKYLKEEKYISCPFNGDLAYFGFRRCREGADIAEMHAAAVDEMIDEASHAVEELREIDTYCKFLDHAMIRGWFD